MKLIIGNKNYSSWSLRAWLTLAKSGVDFEEIKLPLDTPEFYDYLKNITPVQKVPTLIDGELTVWDSLAICEYVDEAYMQGRGWPEDLALRARARSLACEMHSGFNALRNEMSMNIRATRWVELSDAAKKDVARIDALFAGQWREFGDKGGWLFGDWSIADAMYAPVVLRLKSYGIELSQDAARYVAHALDCPEMKQWIDAALEETDVVEQDETGEPV